MRTGSDHKEVRKVQFTGRSTYVLSLPKKWIEEMHLHAGDQVTLVRELDNSLSVVPIAAGPSERHAAMFCVLVPPGRLSISSLCLHCMEHQVACRLKALSPMRR